MFIKTAGSFGSKSKSMNLTTFVISEKIAVDCGNFFSKVVNLSKIEHIFLTHSHLDHIQDLPFFIDRIPFDKKRKNKVKIYGNSQVIEVLNRHIFNGIVWPTLDKFKLYSSSESVASLTEIKPFEEIEIDGITVIPISANHTIQTNGYAFIKEEKGFVISGDTFKNPSLWQFVNKEKRVKKVFVDVSYPSEMRSMAELAKHHTPETLMEDMKKHNVREDVDIYIYHQKFPFVEKIEKEIESLKRKFIPLKDETILEV